MISKYKSFQCRQLQIVHRHGDRTPLFNVFQGNSLYENHEKKIWFSLLPTGNDAIQSNYTDTRFVNNDDSDTFSPFGLLTRLGHKQMEIRGKQLKCMRTTEDIMQGINYTNDVLLYSTAYKRAQDSLQAFFHGLTGVSRSIPVTIPAVNVLPANEDFINAYPMYPELAHMKTTLEKVNEEFASREQAMVNRKADLQRLLPMFSNGCVPFLWMTSADYFTCRKAHNIPYLPHTQEHMSATLRHLIFRFQQFYSNREILNLVVGALVKKMVLEMNKVIQGQEDKKKLIIYSGHDVTLLAILYALDATIIKDENWWPSYSSSLSFELLEDNYTSKWYVRVALYSELNDSHSRTAQFESLETVENFKTTFLQHIQE